MKKIIAIILASVLLFAALHITAFAASAGSTTLIQTAGINEVVATWPSIPNAATYEVKLYLNNAQVGGTYTVSSTGVASYNCKWTVSAAGTYTVQIIGKDSSGLQVGNSLAASCNITMTVTSGNFVFTRTGTSVTVDWTKWTAPINVVPTSYNITYTVSGKSAVSQYGITGKTFIINDVAATASVQVNVTYVIEGNSNAGTVGSATLNGTSASTGTGTGTGTGNTTTTAAGYTTVEFTVPVYTDFGYIEYGDYIKFTLPSREVGGVETYSYAIVSNGISYQLGTNGTAATTAWGNTVKEYSVTFGTLTHSWDGYDTVLPQSIFTGGSSAVQLVGTFPIEYSGGVEVKRVKADSFKLMDDAGLENKSEENRGWYCFTSDVSWCEKGTSYDVCVTDNNGNASYCWNWQPTDKKTKPSEGLAFTLSQDGTYYTCTGLGTCTDTEIIVPSEYNGLPVKAVSFYNNNNTTVTSLIIPEGVTGIGLGYFGSLKELIIPNSTESIILSSSLPYLQTNKYGNAVYLGNTSNPYVALIRSASTGITECVIHPNTKVICGYGTRGAFSDCTSLTEIIIPDSVTSIGQQAFSGCTNLSDVIIGNGVTSISHEAFKGCTNLSDVTIGTGVTSISSNVFKGCTSLASIVIPDSVTSIGQYAFYNCTNLSDVTIGTGVTSIGYNAFSGSSNLKVTFKYGTKAICDGALGGCYGLTQVIIPNSVTSIGDNAFSGCRSLANIEIPDSVTSIGDYAFSYCTSLANIEIPDSVTSIGNYAFSGCSSFASVDIPDSVTSIGYYAFSGCSSLVSVDIGNSVTSIGNGAFSGCTSLTAIYLPASVTKINGRILDGCTSLSSIEIDPANTAYYSVGNCIVERKSKTIIEGCNGSALPAGCDITNIGTNAFTGFEGIESFIIPDSVTTIGARAFEQCVNLKEVYIPASVIYIDSSAFSGCSGLAKITFGGSEDQWNKVFKGSNWNANTGNYEVVFTKENVVDIPGDVNGDGKINSRDLLHLAKYLAGWDVVLH